MTRRGFTNFLAGGASACALLSAGCATAPDAAAPAATIRLTGAHEVPGPGDADGSGMARIRLDEASGSVCFELVVRDIAPATMAHIHPGAAGEAGSPPLVALAAPTSGRSQGCVAVPQAVAARLRANPAAFFVNIHNAPFPGGALRGQLQL
jgi:hypothetical protein